MIRQTRLALLIPLLSGSTSALLSSTAATRGITSSLILLSTANADNMDHYRKDGVRITHDPYAPGMAEKYGLPGQTDSEGFDPYADTVGPGIYGGSVKRSENGEVLIGEQYQNHNNRPGPVYDGKGYSLMSRAVHAGPDKVKEILADYPDLKEELSTGGARPLHVCGMSKSGQLATQALIDAGADIYAKDTYGYTALHRMASNNLEIGGEALVKAGHDPNMKMEGAHSTPIEIARRSRAIQFLMKMEALGHYE
ncbi:MAG: hypothetical protein SGILL_003105 [Bacillariaceae sp.]